MDHPQFKAEEFQEFLRTMGTKHCMTASYHPQSNGLIERMHRTFKNTLRCLNDKVKDLEATLPTALLAYRTAISDYGVSVPALMVHRPVTIDPASSREFVQKICKEHEHIRKMIRY